MCHRLTVALQCDIYSFGVILWEIVTGEGATRGRLFEPKVIMTSIASRWGLHLHTRKCSDPSHRCQRVSLHGACQGNAQQMTCPQLLL